MKEVFKLLKILLAEEEGNIITAQMIREILEKLREELDVKI